MAFVVPDEMIEKGMEALLNAGPQLSFALQECDDEDSCEDKREGLVPAQHLHSHSPGVVNVRNPIFSVDFFAQSKVLSALPRMDATLLAPPSSGRGNSDFAKSVAPEYLLSSNSTTLPGIHAAGQHPVLVPRPDILLESYYGVLAEALRKGVHNDLIFSLESDIARLVRHVHRLGHLDQELMSPAGRELFHKYKDTSMRPEIWLEYVKENF